MIVRYTIDLLQTVPADWDAGDIEFHRNDSSWCSSNMLDDLDSLGCICGITEAKYVREATAEDEAAFVDRRKAAPGHKRATPTSQSS